MTYTISKDFTFSASHRLDGLPDGHPCGRLHGHNYTVRVQLSGDNLDAAGMLFDYGRLAPFARYLDDCVDHRHLNSMIDNPTAEGLARLFADAVFDHVDGVPDDVTVAVGVSETPKTWAWWTP